MDDDGLGLDVFLEPGENVVFVLFPLYVFVKIAIVFLLVFLEFGNPHGLDVVR